MAHLKNRDSNRARREQRQAEALVRQELAAQKTLAERLAKFNATLGVGIGAARERAKLGKEPAKAAVEAPSAPQEPTKAPKKAKGGKRAVKAP